MAFLYVIDKDFFEHSSLSNPIMFNDFYLESKYPLFFKTDYDIKIMATKSSTKAERAMPFYNDYAERYGSSDISVIDDVINSSNSEKVFLNGFSQKQFEYVAPLIKDKVRVLYLFKCPRINDLSPLAKFSKLECVLIYWNNSLETLWNMQQNDNLRVISFDCVTKLRNIEPLIYSNVEYINFDTCDNNGKKKEMLFDKSIFDKMPNLKYLNLRFKGIDEHITLG